MKKFLLLTAGILMALAVNAQTYNNPRQSSNDSRAKVVKVERTANSTIVYLKFTTNNSNTKSWLEPYPTLTDVATGKKYQAKEAMNFNWNGVSTGTRTYKIKFPALPKSTTSVTYRDAGNDGWVIKSIALPVQKANTNTNKQGSSNGFSKTYNNPSQKSNNKSVKVVKVIRTNEYTIVHFSCNLGNYNALKMNTAKMTLVDDDTEKAYKATKALNFKNETAYHGNPVFKVQFPPLPKSVSVVRFRESSNDNSYLRWSITVQLSPIKTQSNNKNNNNNKTVNINVY